MKDKVETLYELHETSVARMNELEFMKDEQSFLEHLLSSHFLELSAPDLYDTTRKLIKKLKEVEHLGSDLMTEVQLFNKQIANSLDDKKTNIISDSLKKQRIIQTDFENYSLKFRYVKKKIFGLVKDIMIAHKQKLLINKQ
ncbi:hypothetical protein QWY87_00705 [Lutimonas halocynthiae]|uniref:hypothetical protein n=1 Tax=Lutimonas halocynthiae TaxID=1446477 RepID=UPI0025B28427|nr:hypothetical protein [Lutimonas halocynthiae]MDN3641201.1 hypothetical protein [Lutimonas halocynthiae]